LINCVLENANGGTHPPGNQQRRKRRSNTCKAILAVTGKVTLYNC